MLRETGDAAGARPLHERALAIREKQLGPDHPDVSWSLNNLAALLQDTEDAAGAPALYERSMAIVAAFVALGARPLYEQALAICETRLGPEHPGVAIPLINLALLHHAAGDSVGARPLFDRALAIKEKQ